MKKKMMWLLVLALLSVLMLSACTTSNDSAVGSSTISAIGGKGGYGGNNGTWLIDTYNLKGVTISRSGAADASFSTPDFIPIVSLGSNSVTITSDTIVPVLPNSGPTPTSGLYQVQGFTSLFLGQEGMGTTPPAAGGIVVSGLRVNEGITLTLGLNYDSDVNSGLDEAYITFTNDLDVAGTLKVADLTTSITGSIDIRHDAVATARDMGSLYIEAFGAFIRPTGSVIAKGLDGAATDERGGDGGSIGIDANNYLVNEGLIDNSGGNGNDLSASSVTDGGDAGVGSDVADEIFLSSNGALINKGTLNANGGNGANGGSSSGIGLFADRSSVYNTGTIFANGGTGSNGDGGSALGLALYSDKSSVFNSGNIVANGGNGSGSGGEGALMEVIAAEGMNVGPSAPALHASSNTARASKIDLDFDLEMFLALSDDAYTGDVVNSGSITLNGGSSTSDGPGGGGGGLLMLARGEIANNANLTLNGGDGKGLQNNGGTGGALTLYDAVPHDQGSAYPIRQIEVSGTILLNGGASETSVGGYGGAIEVWQEESNNQSSDVSNAATEGGIYFLGYASADLSAGIGTDQGGSANNYAVQSSAAMAINTNITDLYMYNNAGSVAYDNDGFPVILESPSGPITNEIDITIRGGNASAAAGMGGTGGSIDWQMDANYEVLASGNVSVLNNSGRIDLSGGTGGTGGGGSGDHLSFWGSDGVTNSADLLLKGGDSTGARGGDGGGILFMSAADIVNTGVINVAGGSGETGGDGAAGFRPGAPASVPGFATQFGKFRGGGVVMSTEGEVRTPGSILANGGAGTVTGGSGGYVNLRLAVEWGVINVDAGTGGETDGSKGLIVINNQLYGAGI